MIFSPTPSPAGSPPTLEETTIGTTPWTPLFSHSCSFPPEIFREVMLNLIRNPNINSNRLFRADISLDIPFTPNLAPDSEIPPRIAHFKDFDLKTVMVRTMIPRNALLDEPLDQTCMFYEQTRDSDIQSLVIYTPHISSASESPFYHPSVRGIAFLHTANNSSTSTSTPKEATLSIHYSFFPTSPRSPVHEQTAHHLLRVLHKHGQGLSTGYVKRVHHDMLLPQAVVQNTYARLKAKHAKALCESWSESTDPTKHVFEDLGIAAFLIELWREMYDGREFPGFVDIGCGNGLLVHILLAEGYAGWGFDARRRKSWATWSEAAQRNLKELVLIPSIIQTAGSGSGSLERNLDAEAAIAAEGEGEGEGVGIHNGIFPTGTFIISNHADELTPWTPILATLSSSPFIMIPCCSHSLSGSRFRAPPPHTPSKTHPSAPNPQNSNPNHNTNATTSAFASLVSWVSNIAQDCGWVIEKEMLRIPSTRNTALIGRKRQDSNTTPPNVPHELGEQKEVNVAVAVDVDAEMKEVVRKYGGAEGWERNAMKLNQPKTTTTKPSTSTPATPQPATTLTAPEAGTTLWLGLAVVLTFPFGTDTVGTAVAPPFAFSVTGEAGAAGAVVGIGIGATMGMEVGMGAAIEMDVGIGAMLAGHVTVVTAIQDVETLGEESRGQSVT
ncbi:tRNA (uracil-O(2)-)-methyltransferase, partial [Lachnellula occidentalis]